MPEFRDSAVPARRRAGARAGRESSRPEPPKTAIPERFNAIERYPEATVSAASLADESWWKIFNDPVLDAFVEKARTSNSTLQEAAARLEKSRALLRGAAAARTPQVGGNGGVSQRTGPLINESGQSGRLIYPNAGVSYEVDLLGRLSKAKKAARLDATASADLLRFARLLVEADTVQAYFEICGLDEERSILAKVGRRSALDAEDPGEARRPRPRDPAGGEPRSRRSRDHRFRRRGPGAPPSRSRRRARLADGGGAVRSRDSPGSSERRRSSPPISPASSSPGAPTSRPDCAASRPPGCGSGPRRCPGCRA
jgi:hypothetical protein